MNARQAAELSGWVILVAIGLWAFAAAILGPPSIQVALGVWVGTMATLGVIAWGQRWRV